MPPACFPLRWETTRHQWWFASPIDWVAANGLYDVVTELLYLDPNLLIKLTSLRRIRRLETVWDDEAQFDDVAKCRGLVARKLLHDCEYESETAGVCNSLIRAGYGGWLLYTAASAGDADFVKELLAREPLLVFGEGEYGLTDIFYAGARSKNNDIFRLLLDFSVQPRPIQNSARTLEVQPDEVSAVFKWEVINRAVHAASRGGNLEILGELLADCSDVLAYRDAQGSTILHTASGRGQVQVVEYLIASYDIITSTDDQGNAALNVASYKGYLPVVEVLILNAPSSTSLANNCGDTVLHMAVAGFRAPSFRRLDRQIELIKVLVSGKIVNIQDIINVRNNEGRTALHMAVIENMQSYVVELLMNVPSINLNIQDVDGMTPLDLLKQQPQTASSDILVKQLISAGGISNCEDYMARSTLFTNMGMQGIGSSPGSSFRIPDAEILLHIGSENDSESSFNDASHSEFSPCSSELNRLDSSAGLCLSDDMKSRSMRFAARHLRNLLQWPRRKEGKGADDDDSSEGHTSIRREIEGPPTPLRKNFSKVSSFPINKRTLSFRSNLPSPFAKKKFAAGLMHGVIQVTPQVATQAQSPKHPCSRSPMSSSMLIEKHRSVLATDSACSDVGRFPRGIQNQPSLNKRLMNQYLCFGAQGIAVEDSIRCKSSFLP